MENPKTEILPNSAAAGRSGFEATFGRVNSLGVQFKREEQQNFVASNRRFNVAVGQSCHEKNVFSPCTVSVEAYMGNMGVVSRADTLLRLA